VLLNDIQGAEEAKRPVRLTDTYRNDAVASAIDVRARQDLDRYRGGDRHIPYVTEVQLVRCIGRAVVVGIPKVCRVGDLQGG